MQLNLGTITPEQNNKIRNIMYEISIEIDRKITKLDLFFILLDEKEKKLFGENHPENFYIEKEKTPIPELKTREEMKIIAIEMIKRTQNSEDLTGLESMIENNTNREMEKQRIEHEKLINKNKKQEW